MNRYRVVFLGDSSSGKTQLYKQILTGKDVDAFDENSLTVIPECGVKALDPENFISLLDLSGAENYANFFADFEFKNTHVGLFCVDLTKQPDEEYIKRKIKLFQSILPRTAIILVGTKADHPQANRNLLKTLASEGLYATLITSAKTGEGIDELSGCLSSFCGERQKSALATHGVFNRPKEVDFIYQVGAGINASL